MMALMSGALEMCAPALGTCVPSCIRKPARFFFMREACGHKGPRDMWPRRSPPQPGGEVWSRVTCGSAKAHLSREVRSGAKGHVAVPEPISTRRRGLELQVTLQRRGPPQPGGKIRSHRTHGSAGAHLGREAMSGVVRHVAVRGCMPCYLLILRPVCRGTGMQGIDSGPWADVGRGYEPAGGANSSVPYSVMFNFLLCSSSNSDLSRSLGAQGPKKSY
jgi:hypothetical protein